MVTGGEICQTRTAGFQSTNIFHQWKVEKKEMKMKSTSICPKPLVDVNKENLLSPCRINFKFLNEALKYTQYHFENKLWNKNETFDYLRTCCLQKCCFQCYWGFSTRAGVSWYWHLSDVWGVLHKYYWFFWHCNVIGILGYQKIHDDSIITETKVRKELTIWKDGNQALFSVQRECF